MVFIHGGAWRTGDKRQGGRLMSELFTRGYAMASVNYRLVPRGSVQGAAADVAEAIAFLATNAKRYHLRTDRIVLIGHSAGAQLAALVAADHRYLARAGINSVPATVVTLDGVAFDPFSAPGNRRGGGMIEQAFGADRGRWKDVSVVEQLLTTSAIPHFCVFYSPDRRVSMENSEPLLRTLASRGHPAKTYPQERTQHMQFVAMLDGESPLFNDLLSCLKGR